jgi:hypothetical protein
MIYANKDYPALYPFEEMAEFIDSNSKLQKLPSV